MRYVIRAAGGIACLVGFSLLALVLTAPGTWSGVGYASALSLLSIALPSAMANAYQRMHESEGDVPSPVLATYAGMQTPSEHDDIEIGDAAGTGGAVVFLHGFAGSFTLPCWEISRAAARAHLATVCPATGWRGDWWSAEGERIVRATIASLRARGVAHLYLAGLSNGGVGVSRLAPRLPGTLRGVIVISGAAPEAPNPGVPLLVIQGRNDAMMPAAVARDYAERSAGRYVELDAGHFAMLLRAKEARDAMVPWLTQREAAR